MNWFTKFLMGQMLLMDEKKEGEGGGGGGPDAAALAKENADLKAKLADLEKKITPPKDPPDADLAAKAAKQREESEKSALHEKNLETAIKFTAQSKDWVKNNASLLPKNFESIIEQAEKEKYPNAIEKANAVKATFITEFFGVQANLDQLTSAQKVALEDFKNLTKDKRHEQAQHVFDTLLEPTIESMKKEARARQVGKGFRETSSAEDRYKERRIKEARKQFLGEK